VSAAQARSVASLGPQALPVRIISYARNALERDWAIELGVVRAIDISHTAGTEPLQYGESTDTRAGQVRSIRSGLLLLTGILSHRTTDEMRKSQWPPFPTIKQQVVKAACSGE
jgi:hypothetical protein